MPFIFALLVPILSPVSGSTSSPSTTCIGSVCFAGVDGCDAMCHGYTTCESCARIGVGCGWCPSLQRCLYGTDTQSTSSAPECNRAAFPAINWCACSEHVGSRLWEVCVYHGFSTRVHGYSFQVPCYPSHTLRSTLSFHPSHFISCSVGVRASVFRCRLSLC